MESMIGENPRCSSNNVDVVNGSLGFGRSQSERLAPTIHRFDPLYNNTSGVRDKMGPITEEKRKLGKSMTSLELSPSSVLAESRETETTVDTANYDLTEALRRLAIEVKQNSSISSFPQQHSPHPTPPQSTKSADDIPSKAMATSTFLNSPKKSWQRKLGLHRKSRSVANSITMAEMDMVNMPRRSSATGAQQQHPLTIDSWSLQQQQSAAQRQPTNGNGNRSPPRNAQQASSTNDTMGSPARRPWQLKRGNSRMKNSQSITMGDVEANKRRNEGPANTQMRASLTTTGESTMIMDLWHLHDQHDMSALQPPSLLAKPRPTSFLAFNDESGRTSEQDASTWQVGIPEKNEFQVCAKITQFLDRYRSEECLLDLQLLVGCNRLDLTSFANGGHSPIRTRVAEFHQPVVETLLESARDLVEVRGYFTTSSADSSQDSRREVMIIERQRQFVCVFRGTTSEQQGKFSKQADTTTTLQGGVKVFSDRYAALQPLENQTFALLDKLAEDNPFCDVVFTGHSFGAAVATVAAYRYALGRPQLRISALVTGCPRVGPSEFRRAVHSTPNLKVMRLEYGHNRSGGQGQQTEPRLAGHTIRINSAVGTSKSSTVKQPVLAYRFDFGNKQKKVGRPVQKLFKREKDISEYVHALEELEKYKAPNNWVEDYERENSGSGVVGRDNEKRLVV